MGSSNGRLCLLFGLLPESQMMKVYGGLDYGNIRIGGLVLRLFWGRETFACHCIVVEGFFV
jgi:hypothetical protein